MNFEDCFIIYSQIYTWENMVQDHYKFLRTYQYHWINGHINHPLSIERTVSCQNISKMAYSFLTEKFHSEKEESIYIKPSQLIRGRVATDKQCPYANICEIRKNNLCNHIIGSNVEFACSQARVLDLVYRRGG